MAAHAHRVLAWLPRPAGGGSRSLGRSGTASQRRGISRGAAGLPPLRAGLPSTAFSWGTAVPQTPWRARIPRDENHARKKQTSTGVTGSCLPISRHARAVQGRRALRGSLVSPDEVAHDGASSWPHVIARQNRPLGGGDQAVAALPLVAAPLPAWCCCRRPGGAVPTRPPARLAAGAGGRRGCGPARPPAPAGGRWGRRLRDGLSCVVQSAREGVKPYAQRPREAPGHVQR